MIAVVLSIGAACFGVVLGYITYRPLVRKDDSSISDIAAVVAAIGGGVVTQLFDPATTDTFSWYSIGLLVGMTVFLILRIVLERPTKPGGLRPTVLSDGPTQLSATAASLGEDDRPKPTTPGD
jgi:membrane associated rhomboid family serine protease